jgi:hypothetical protein
MLQNYSTHKTPITSKSWKDKSVEKRIELITNELKKDKLYDKFEPVNAPENGQVVIKIEKVIPTNERGLLLLELEQKLKSNIDKGITIWCEPVGDKSKLRKLRGIKINS